MLKRIWLALLQMIPITTYYHNCIYPHNKDYYTNYRDLFEDLNNRYQFQNR